MIAYLKDQQIFLDLVSPDIEEALVKQFSIFNPKAIFTTAYEMGQWDGRINKYSRQHKRLAIPFLNELKKFCEVHDYPLDIEDNRTPIKYSLLPKESITDTLLPGIILEDYQSQAILSTYNNEIGIHCHPTGGGKTEIIAGIVASRPDCPTVIIAEEKIVLKQIVQRLQLRKVAEEVGKFFAGKRPSGQTVIVGSIQALRMPSKKERQLEIKRTGADKAWQTRHKNATFLQDALKCCAMILVDECDRCTSDSYDKLFNEYAVNARWRYGFSGTPFDDGRPVQNLILRERLGSIISQSDRLDVQDRGRTIPIEYYMFTTNEDGDKHDKTENNAAIKEHMINNDRLHDLIYKICNHYRNDGTLILVDSIDMGNKLLERIPGSEFIYGNTSDTKRAEVLKRFEERSLNVLIGSKILRRGLDLDGGCENLILCYDGQMQSEFLQRIGRAVRLNKKGYARVFDFMIMSNYYLYKHARERLKSIIQTGYTATVIHKGNIRIKAEDLIKRRWRFPKK